MNMSGYLLRASTRGCVVGSHSNELHNLRFGNMVRIPAGQNPAFDIFGILYEISIDDDGMVRQLVSSGDIAPEIIEDNRTNRMMPLELSVLFLGYRQENEIFHLVPPHPPMTLEKIIPCSDEDMRQFTQGERFGYFRHILNADLPAASLLAAHIQLLEPVHKAAGNTQWDIEAVQQLITMLRDDYASLNAVLLALADTKLFNTTDLELP